MKQAQTFPLDTSAIIHLAARRRWHTNSFRWTLTLAEEIDPTLLQLAFERAAHRFPTLVAGIRAGLFRHTVVPVQQVPKVKVDQACLACMTKDEVTTCAMRVLYRGKQLSVEVLHSLTDGHGALVFLKSLLAEYLNLKYEVVPSSDPMVLALDQPAHPGEWVDDYITHAGSKKESLGFRKTYQLPGKRAEDGIIRTTRRTYDLNTLLDAAHRAGGSLTTFFAAVMIGAIQEIRRRSGGKRPIQIMVPANLRYLFASQTLRNFSLYALPGADKSQRGLSLPDLARHVDGQLKEQFRKDKLAGAMAAHTGLDRALWARMIPLPFKCLVLKGVHHFFGEQNSCITLSNLGAVTLPPEWVDHVEQIDLLLTPRIASPYNCGIVSYNGRCQINFTRRCAHPELEEVFFQLLEQQLRQ